MSLEWIHPRFPHRRAHTFVRAHTLGRPCGPTLHNKNEYVTVGLPGGVYLKQVGDIRTYPRTRPSPALSSSTYYCLITLIFTSCVMPTRSNLADHNRFIIYTHPHAPTGVPQPSPRPSLTFNFLATVTRFLLCHPRTASRPTPPLAPNAGAAHNITLAVVSSLPCPCRLSRWGAPHSPSHSRLPSSSSYHYYSSRT